jgi:EF-hand domain pair
MYSRILGLTTSALILAGIVGAFAQGQMTPQPDQQQMQPHPMGQEGTLPMWRAGPMWHGSMMGPPVMMRMMFALMDADGDGTIELQEFQAAHERIFKAMDTNKDGKVTLEEMQAFIHGTR